MTKRIGLASIKSRLSPRPAILSHAGSNGRGSPGNKPKRKANRYAALYAGERWKRLRLAYLDHVDFTCEQTGVRLNGLPYTPTSAVVDHKVPHNGDLERFYDWDNLQAVTKEWHDRDKQRLEAGGFLHWWGDVWGDVPQGFD